MARRFATGVALGAAVAVSLAGCNSSGGTKNAGGSHSNAQLTAAQEISRISQKAGTVNSFKAHMSIAATAQGKSVSVQGAMAVQARPKVLMDLNLTNVQAAGQSVTGGIEEILTGDAIYIKSPALTKAAGSAKPWMKMSLSAIKQETGLDIQSQLNQGEQVDPATNLKMFTASTNARKVGTETVGGVTTTHYQGTYSLQQALAKLTADERSKVQQSLTQLGVNQMDFNLWVDGQNLPRKMVLATPAGATSPMNITVTYSDFNKHVTVTAPPASEVGPAPKMAMPGATA
jgi:hypothetical protein